MKIKTGNMRPWRLASNVIAVAACLLAGTGIAQTTPVGLWETVDEDTGKAKSLVRIAEHDGILDGRIEKLMDPDDPADAVCEKCPDERRNKPVRGMVIIRNVKKATGPTARQWEGGDILDPENGQLYRVRLMLSPDGRRLDVRGYIGTPLLGRTQTWLRVE